MNNTTKYELEIYKQTKVIFDEICNNGRLSKLSTEKINADVAMAITEIISIYMRDIARENNYVESDELVEQAVSKAQAIFKKRLLNKEFETYYDIINTYLDIASKDLKRKPDSNNKLSFAKSIVETKRQELPKNLYIKEANTSRDHSYDSLLSRLSKIKSENHSKDKKIHKLKLIQTGFENYIEGLLIYPELEDV